VDEDPKAQRELGLLYYHGYQDSVPVDYSLAVEYFRKAANQGDVMARFYLGVCYHRGHGVQPDLTKSISVYRKAAERGHYLAQTALYSIHRCGNDTEGRREAEEWYRAMNRYWIGSVNILKVMYDGATESKEHDALLLGNTLVISRQRDRGKVTCMIELQRVGPKFKGVKVSYADKRITITLKHHAVSHPRWRKNVLLITLSSVKDSSGRFKVSDGFEKLMALLYCCEPFPPNLSPSSLADIIQDVSTFFSSSRMDLFAVIGSVIAADERDFDTSKEQKEIGNYDALLFAGGEGAQYLGIIADIVQEIPIPVIAQGLSATLRLASSIKQQAANLDEVIQFKTPRLIGSMTDLEDELRVLAHSEDNWLKQHALQAQKCYERAHGILLRTRVFTKILSSHSSGCMALWNANKYSRALDALTDNLQEVTRFIHSEKVSAQGAMSAKILSRLEDVSSILKHVNDNLSPTPNGNRKRIESQVDRIRDDIQFHLMSPSDNTKELEDFASQVEHQVTSLLKSVSDQSMIKDDEVLELIRDYWNETHNALRATLSKVEEIRQRQIKHSRRLKDIYECIVEVNVKIDALYALLEQKQEEAGGRTFAEAIMQLKKVREAAPGSEFYVELVCGRSLVPNESEPSAEAEGAVLHDADQRVETVVQQIFQEKAPGDVCSVLLLGPSGAGKSTAMRQIEQRYWTMLSAEKLGREEQFVPFLLALKNTGFGPYQGKPVREIALLQLGIPIENYESQLNDLKLRPIWMFDGYDDVANGQSLGPELYHGGLSIVSCRQQFLDTALEGQVTKLFPQSGNLCVHSEVFYLRAFDGDRSLLFIEKMLQAYPQLATRGDAAAFKRGVDCLENFRGLETRPYMLKLIVGLLPKLAEQHDYIRYKMYGMRPSPEVSTVSMQEKVNITDILEEVVTAYFELAKESLCDCPDWSSSLAYSFTRECRQFCMNLALKMYKEHTKTFVASLNDRYRNEGFAKLVEWDIRSDEGFRKLLFVLQSVPIETSDGLNWSFQHSSFLEYFYACWNLASPTRVLMTTLEDASGPTMRDPTTLRESALSTSTTPEEEGKQELDTSLVQTLGAHLFENDEDLLRLHAELLRRRPETQTAYVNLVRSTSTGARHADSEEAAPELHNATRNAKAVLEYGAKLGAVRENILDSVLNDEYFAHRITVPSALSVSVFKTVSAQNLYVHQEMEFSEHTNSVNNVAFSPNGLTLLSCSRDGTVRLWNMKSLTQRDPIRTGHEVTAVDLNIHGTVLAAGEHKGSIRLWSYPSLKPAAQFAGPEGRIVSLRFSPVDPALLVSASGDDAIRFWDVSRATPKRVIMRAQSGLLTLAFSSDGKFLVTGGKDRRVRIWRVSNGKPELEFFCPDACTSVAISPPNGSGRSWLAAGCEDGTIAIWHYYSRERRLEPRCTLEGHSAGIRSLCFSGDGTVLASGSKDQTIRLWSMAELRLCITTLTGHEGSVQSVCFNPNGSALASGGSDKTVRLWSISSSPGGEPHQVGEAVDN